MQRINPSFAVTLRMTILFALGAAGCTTYASLTLGSGGSGGSQDASAGAGGTEDPPTGGGGSGGASAGSGGSGAATTGSGGSAGVTTGAGGSSGTTTGSGGSSGTTTGSGGSAGTSTGRDGSSEASAGSGGSSGATGSGGAAGTSTGSGGSGGGSAGSGGFAGTSTGSDGSADASADSGGGGGIADASGGKDRGDAGGPFSPLCSDVPLTTAGEVPTKGGTCTTTDTQLCYKTCGPLSLGFKSETCMGGVYVEQSNCSFPDGDYSCYRIPPVISAACPTTTPQATQACSVAECVLCNVAGDYLDSTGAMKMGYCVCPAGGDSATRKWSCASTTSWPCPDGDGC